MAETCLLYKEVRRVSVECRLIKPGKCGLKSKLEVMYRPTQSLIKDGTMHSVSLDIHASQGRDLSVVVKDFFIECWFLEE